MGDMRTLAARVIDTRLGGKVERCHNIPHHGGYNVAAHSWGVAMLLHALWPEDFPRLALAALAHDVPEGWVGDLPSPTMRYSGCAPEIEAIERGISRRLQLPHLNDLAEEDREKVLACDRLEFYLWCGDQALLGNQFVNEPLRALERIWGETPLPDRAQEFFLALQSMVALPRQGNVVREVADEVFNQREEIKF